MRSANLGLRLEALERGAGDARSAVLIVGPYAEGAEREVREASARAEWEARNGRPVPTNMRVLHIVLCGRKPGEARQL